MHFTKYIVIRDAYNVIVYVQDGKWLVENINKLPEGTQPQISVEELAKAEETVKADARVQALAKEVGTLVTEVVLGTVLSNVP